MGGKPILYRIDQHTGQINTGARHQNDGHNSNFLIEKNQNRKQQNAHGYTEVAGEYIQIDLGEKNDKNTERQDLFPRGWLCHGFRFLLTGIIIKIAEKSACFKRILSNYRHSLWKILVYYNV